MKSVMISFRVPLNSPIFEWITEQELAGRVVSQEIRSLILKETIERCHPKFQAYMIQNWRYRRLLEYLPENVQLNFGKWLMGKFDGNYVASGNKGRTWHEDNTHEYGWIHPESWKKLKENDWLADRDRMYNGGEEE